MTDKIDVFISYSSQDTELVDQIEEALLDEGLRVWREGTRLKGGTEFGEEIKRNINSSLIGLCLISEDYLNSEWCNAELGMIEASSAYLFPIRTSIDINYSQMKGVLQEISIPTLGDDRLPDIPRLVDILIDKIRDLQTDAEELISTIEPKLSSNESEAKDITDGVNIKEQISVKKEFDKNILSEASNDVFKIAEGLKLANESDKIHMEHLIWAIYSFDHNPDNNPLFKVIKEKDISVDVLIDTIRGKNRYKLLEETTSEAYTDVLLDTITDHTFESINSAFDISKKYNSELIEPIHLLHGFFSVTECSLVKRLIKLGLEPPAIESITDTEPNNDIKSFNIPNKPERDVWTTDDKLNYRIYSKAISNPILDGYTEPPITIAIQAPWGQGKTSLMRMIQEELENKSNVGDDDHVDDRMLKTSNNRASFNDLWKWLDDQSKVDNMLEAKQHQIPTVWFNPLYYQDKEQIWAGMAHTILTQLTDRLKSFKKREEFWLRLQMKRLNKEAIRRDFHKLILEDFIPKALIYLSIVIIICIVSIFFGSAFLGLSILPIGKGIFDFNSFKKNMEGKNLQGKFETYISEPNYNDKLGFLHLVDHDIDKALELLVGNEKIVIFIDDLDRCSPDVISEVILAINQFISLKSRKVIFILGMDTEIVAQSIESVYKHLDIKSNVSNINNENSEIVYQRSFGWQFMDKFIQVPFTIPRLTPDKAKAYMKDLLTEYKDGELNTQESIEEDNESENKFIEAAEQAQTTEEIRNIIEEVNTSSEKVRNKVMSKVSDKLSEIVYDPRSKDRERFIEFALQDLDLNPRTIKRFINLAGLYNFIDVLQNPMYDASRKLVIRYVHLRLNWMPFVRLLQEVALDSPDNNSNNILNNIEDALHSSKDFDEWKQNIKDEPTIKNIIYLYDESLYSFLHKIHNDATSLSSMREVGFI